MKRIFTALLFLGFLAVTTQAQVVVNEFSASNLDQFPDNYGLYEDWVELYNTSGSSVNIGGFFLSDNENRPDKWRIPSGTTIPANGYVVFWCSGRDEVSGGAYHTNFKLKQTKDSEEIVLSDQDTLEINNIPLGRTQLDHSFCRDINGGAAWVVDISPTPNASNGSTAIDIEMDISEWFKNPNTWNLNEKDVNLMGDFDSQLLMNQNGASVFSLVDITQ